VVKAPVSGVAFWSVTFAVSPSATKLSPFSVELLAVRLATTRLVGVTGMTRSPAVSRRRAGLDKFGDRFDLRMRRERKRPPRFLESHCTAGRAIKLRTLI
jgi:hypothetical protein